MSGSSVSLDVFSVDSDDFHSRVVPYSPVGHRFVYRKIRVLQVHVLADHSDTNVMFWVLQPLDDFFPFI